MVEGANIVLLFGSEAAHHRDRRTIGLGKIDARPDVGARTGVALHRYGIDVPRRGARRD